MKIYGIKNCTTVRNALKFLDDNKISYEFIDYKKNTPDSKKITFWMDALGQNVVFNSNSATFKKLKLNKDATQKEAVELCLQYPNILKRPILEFEKDTSITLIAGFDKDAKQKYEILVDKVKKI